MAKKKNNSRPQNEPPKAASLTHQQLQTLGETLNGTCDTIERAIEKLGLNPDDYDVNDLEAELLNVAVECCKGCGWWMEPSELVPDPEELENPEDEEEKTGYCKDCR